jgi:hypothetical protein
MSTLRPAAGHLAAIALLLGACSAAEDAVILRGRAVGLVRPYQERGSYDAPAPTVFAALGRALQRSGATIIESLPDSGLLSWITPGSGFSTLPGWGHRRTIGTGATSISLSTWHGVVHGAGRLREWSGGIDLYLHAVGRDRNPASPRVLFSDGTYERSLLRDVERSIGSPEAATSRIRVLPRTDVPDGNFLDSVDNQFRGFPEVPSAEIRRVGFSRILPVRVEEAWAACLDVATQYDVVVRANESERTLVFAHATVAAAREEGPGRSASQAQAVLALHVAARGDEGSELFVARLVAWSLTVAPVYDLEAAEDLSDLEPLKRDVEAFAAARVADEFTRALTTQLLYRDRWRGKLDRAD